MFKLITNSNVTVGNGYFYEYCKKLGNNKYKKILFFIDSGFSQSHGAPDHRNHHGSLDHDHHHCPQNFRYSIGNDQRPVGNGGIGQYDV